jgi:hypothetical protein
MHDLYSEIAAAIRNQGESGFIVSPNLFAALEPCAGGIYHHRIPVKAGHHSFNVVAVEGVKVALNQFLAARDAFPNAALRYRPPSRTIYRVERK